MKGRGRSWQRKCGPGAAWRGRWQFRWRRGQSRAVRPARFGEAVLQEGLNGSGRVTTADYSVVKSNIGHRTPAKP
ncbi:MAG TPA: hypothetical protein VMZ31_12570 [Phycisphaerae bacterium]|nr:hypothetical protein [Phycisphaerae bacterium]